MFIFKSKNCGSSVHGTLITWMDWSISETAITRSPVLIIPLALSKENVLFRLLSISSEKLNRNGIIPHCRLSRRLIDGSVVKANIGQSGRQRDKRDAICPDFVYTKIASTSKLLAVNLQKSNSILHNDSSKTLASKSK